MAVGAAADGVAEGVAQKVVEKLATLPHAPGVYLFRGKNDRTLYVGKARDLRQRVHSYFHSSASDERAFIAHLSDHLVDIDTLLVANDKEAALLENQLIKQLRPLYNVKLRDDKTYPSLRLNAQAAWPRLEVVRRPTADGARYFGPYPSASATRQTLGLVNRHFQLRTCSDREMATRQRPCLQYQIKRCLAPCVLPVDQQLYAEQVRNVSLFLDGRHDQLVEQLKQRMQAASAAQRYEEASLYRDQLQAVDKVREGQRVAAVRDVDQDVIGFFRQADQCEITQWMLRAGKVVDVRAFAMQRSVLPNAELVAAFVRDCYADGTYRPQEIIVPMPLEMLQGWLEPSRLLHPQRGARAALLRLAMDNAAHSFAEKARAREDLEARLLAVQKRLRLPKLPRRIECIDISHTGGEDPVASVVCLVDGAPERRAYKSFVLRRSKGGDDYGGMHEALLRRLRRGALAERGWELPDLLVVDGGRGQLQVALQAARDAEVAALPIVGLAKERDEQTDRVYLPEQKNAIPMHSEPALAMLALARDEAHRSSNLLRSRRFSKRRLPKAR